MLCKNCGKGGCRGKGGCGGMKHSGKGGFVGSAIRKVKGYLDENKRAMDYAKGEMDKKYPAGFSQNPYHMGEVNTYMKQYKNRPKTKLKMPKNYLQ